jgi:tetratricopeptide (TPR) repeat protein
VLGRKIAVDPRMTFGAIDPVMLLFNVARFDERLEAGEVRILAQGLRETNPVRKSYVVRLRGHPPGRLIGLGHSIPAGELEPDYYRLTLTLVDGAGTAVDESSANFIVTPERAIAHPVANSRAVPAAAQYLYAFMLARQYAQAGAADRAEAFFERGLAAKPDYGNGLVWYAQFMLQAGKFDRALEIVERLKDDRPKAFEYWLLRGSALMGKRLYDDAIRSLLAGNRIYNSDTRLLNALGDCYRNTGRTAEALEAFRASLKLNPEQPEIRGLVAELEKRP